MNKWTSILSFSILFIPEGYAQDFKRGIWKEREIEYVGGEICVKKHPDANPADISSYLRNYGAVIASPFDVLRWGVIRVADTTDIFPLIQQLSSSDLIETMEPNIVGYAGDDPDDPYFAGTLPPPDNYAHQWGLWNFGQLPPGGTIGADINFRKAWGVTKGSPSILLAVLDTGIPLVQGTSVLSHPDLSNGSRIQIGNDFVFGHPSFPGELDATIRDYNGHGTHVAGIMAAETDNGIGVAGVAGQCGIYVDQVFDVNGATTSTIFKNAVLDAVNEGARVINFSGGFSVESGLAEDAVAYAEEYNRIVVSISHNFFCSFVWWPAAFSTSHDNVIAVGATNDVDVRSPFSNCGPELSVVAPGGHFDVPQQEPGGRFIFSTVPDYPTQLGEDYGYAAGTSMAAPHVSGICGLMLSVNQALLPSQVRDILQKTADPKGSPVPNDEYGWGRVDAYQAVLLALAYGSQSHSATATSSNGQRKLLRESGGKLHLAFESGGEVYYRNSTTGGTTWQKTIRLSSGTESNSSVCITERSGIVFAVWQKPHEVETANWNIMYNYSTDGGTTWLSSPVALFTNVASQLAGPQPVVLAGIPANPFEIMIVYKGPSGLYSSRATSASPPWPAPILVNGTNASSRNQSLAYRSNSGNYYKLVWDEPVGGKGKIYFSNWNGTGWSGLTWVNSGTYGSSTSEAKPTISVTSTNTLDIAWQGVHLGNAAIIHNRNLSPIYNIFENAVLGYSNPTITGHTGGNMTLVWQVSNGEIYKTKYNGTSWGSVTSIGSNSSSPSTSVLNPPGGDAKVVWTQGNIDPIYTIVLASQVLNRTTADSSFDIHRAIVISDTSGDAYFSIEAGGITLDKTDGERQTIGFVPAYDSLAYTATELLELFETQPFTVPGEVNSISATRSIFGRTPSRFFSEASVRFEAENTTTGEVISSFGFRELDSRDSTISVSDSTNVPIRGLPDDFLKIRSVIDGLDMTDPGLSTAMLNILNPKNIEQSLEKSSPTQPASYFLSQNYPNPFNPMTNIRYDLPENAYVSLRVYDVLGREVMTLVDGFTHAGNQSVVFDASRFSAGVYFYRLTVGSFTDVKKLLVVK